MNRRFTVTLRGRCTRHGEHRRHPEIYKVGFGGEAAADSVTGCALAPGQEEAFVAIVPDATLSVIVEEGGDAGRLICVIETAERTGSIMAEVAPAS